LCRSNPLAGLDPSGNDDVFPVVEPKTLPKSFFNIQLVDIKDYVTNQVQLNQASLNGHKKGFVVRFNPNGKCGCGGDNLVLTQAIDTSKLPDGAGWGTTDHIDYPSGGNPDKTKIPPGYILLGGMAAKDDPAWQGLSYGYFDSPGMTSATRNGAVAHIEVCAMCPKTGLVLACATFDWDPVKDDFSGLNAGAPGGWQSFGNGVYSIWGGRAGSIFKNGAKGWHK
jgi:hypothetical protein